MDSTKFRKTRGPNLPGSATSAKLRETLEKDDEKDNCAPRTSFHANDIISDNPTIPQLMAEAHEVFTYLPSPEQIAQSRSALKAALENFDTESRKKAKKELEAEVAALEEQMATLQKQMADLQIKLDVAETEVNEFEEDYHNTLNKEVKPLEIKLEKEERGIERMADVLHRLNALVSLDRPITRADLATSASLSLSNHLPVEAAEDNSTSIKRSSSEILPPPPKKRQQRQSLGNSASSSMAPSSASTSATKDHKLPSMRTHTRNLQYFRKSGPINFPNGKFWQPKSSIPKPKGPSAASILKKWEKDHPELKNEYFIHVFCRDPRAVLSKAELAEIEELAKGHKTKGVKLVKGEIFIILRVVSEDEWYEEGHNLYKAAIERTRKMDKIISVELYETKFRSTNSNP